jgi:hypothetical protein
VPGVTDREVLEQLLAALGTVLPLLPATAAPATRTAYLAPTTSTMRRSQPWALPSTRMQT